MKKSPLRRVSERSPEPSVLSVISLLLKDHKAMKQLMKKVKSKRAEPAQIVENFKLLEKLVLSHVKSEEVAFLERVEDHEQFRDDAIESVEEHEIHRNILSGIHQVKNKERKIIRMKIFCEMLEHHLKEEEEELFPKFNKYAALSTRKKMGKDFIKTRVKTRRTGERLGALKKVKK
jgi:heme exporter protein D